MVVKLRLQRFGRKKRPYYRIVATDARKPRDGKPIEFLGTFDPLVDKNGNKKLRLKEDRVNYWLSVGAQPTDRVAKLLGYVNILPPPPFTKKTKRHLPRQDREFSTLVSRPLSAPSFGSKGLPTFAPIPEVKLGPSFSSSVSFGHGQGYSTIANRFFSNTCLGRTVHACDVPASSGYHVLAATSVSRPHRIPAQREALQLGRSAGKLLRVLFRR